MGKGDPLGVYLAVFPGSQPWREEACSILGTQFTEWKVTQETGTPFLLSREIERTEGLCLDRFWLGQHLTMITAPHPMPNPSTSRQASAAGGLPRSPPLPPSLPGAGSLQAWKAERAKTWTQLRIRALHTHTHSLPPHPRQPHSQVALLLLRLPVEGDRVAEEAARVPGLFHHQESGVQVEGVGDAAAGGHHQSERAEHRALNVGGAAGAGAHGCARGPG